MTPDHLIAPADRTPRARAGEAVVVAALTDALVRRRPADAAKRFFGLKTRRLATSGLTALIAVGAASLREVQRSDPGAEIGIEELVERAQATAPITEWETDTPLFWELSQFTACLAGGVRLSAEGLALRYTGEQLLFGAFVVAMTAVQLSAVHLDIDDAEALDRAVRSMR